MKTVREVIQSTFEKTEPQGAILKILREHEGKLADKRLVDRLNSMIPNQEIRIKHQYGMTHLEWGGYGRYQDNRPGGSLLLAHSEKNVFIDVEYILNHNASCFHALEERNVRREASLKMEQAQHLLESNVRKFQEARKAIKELLDNFDVCRYDIIREYNLNLDNYK